jgi:hypothetical protein
MIRTVSRLHRWHRRPEQRPAGPNELVPHLVLPLLGNLGWGLLALLWPRLFDAPLSYLIYSAPDLGYIFLISGLVALAWAIIRTVLLLLLLRTAESRASTVTGTPVRA